MAEDRFVFASSNLASGSHDDETGTMRIEFNSGRAYSWDRVEPIMWDRLKSAPSPGRFLRANFPDGTEE